MSADRLRTSGTSPEKGHARGKRSQLRATRPPARQAWPGLTDQDGRERILSVAIRCFSELGYEGTTTAGVARDARVTQPLVHHHFGSKEGLWRASMDVLFSNVGRIITVPISGSSQDELIVITERFIRFVAAHPEVTRVIAREGAAPNPRLTYLIERYLREPFDQVIDAIRAGQRAGVIDRHVQPGLLLFLLLGAGSHLFDVTALAREGLEIDTNASSTQEDFLVLVRDLLERGLFRRTAKRRGKRETT